MGQNWKGKLRNPYVVKFWLSWRKADLGFKGWLWAHSPIGLQENTQKLYQKWKFLMDFHFLNLFWWTANTKYLKKTLQCSADTQPYHCLKTWLCSVLAAGLHLEGWPALHSWWLSSCRRKKCMEKQKIQRKYLTWARKWRGPHEWN